MSEPAPDAERKALAAAVARLEEVARAISREETAGEALRELAEEALRLSAEITERLPRALRGTAEG